VIDSLDLDVREGEFLSLLGPSGCGKTTILRSIAGLDQPNGGTISIGGKPVVDAGRKWFLPPNKRGLGMVFQSYALWPHMSVFSNVAYPLRLRKRPAAEIKARTEEVLNLVGLGHLGQRGIGELSGGQQQRIALARALAAQPDVLLLDEPLSNLDAALRGQMRRELRRIHREIRRTSIYVTHDQLEAVTLSDRIVVMNRGHIEQIGTPHEVFGTPANRWVAEFVGFDNFLEAEIVARQGDHIVARPKGWPMTVVCTPSEKIRGATIGTAILVAIRSANWRLGALPGEWEIDATVVESTFVGDQTEFSVDAYGSRLICRIADALPASDTQHATSLKLSVAPGLPVALEKSQ